MRKINNSLDRILEAAKKEISSMESILKPNWLQYLDFNYIPKDPKHRENEIKTLVVKIVENVLQRSTRSILVYGQPGTGKTMSYLIAKDLAEEILKEKGLEDYKIIYVTITSPHVSKVLSEICSELGYKVPERGLSVREYLSHIKDIAKDKYLHICIDEFDKLIESRSKKHAEDILYFLTRTENISTTLITNNINLAKNITDARVLSSLDRVNTVFFRTYTKDQCRDILLERVNLAFKEGVFTYDAIDLLAEHVAEGGGDIRLGLSILRYCGEYAVSNNIRKIDKDLMKSLIWKHDVRKDGELLIETLTLTDKIIIISIYQLLLETKRDHVYSGDVFARQDYLRRLIGKSSISRDSFSVYLTRLSTIGVISLKKEWEKGSRGYKTYIHLRYPTDAIKYMIENDPEVIQLRNFIVD